MTTTARRKPCDRIRPWILARGDAAQVGRTAHIFVRQGMVVVVEDRTFVGVVKIETIAVENGKIEIGAWIGVVTGVDNEPAPGVENCHARHKGRMVHNLPSLHKRREFRHTLESAQQAQNEAGCYTALRTPQPC